MDSGTKAASTFNSMVREPREYASRRFASSAGRSAPWSTERYAYSVSISAASVSAKC